MPRATIRTPEQQQTPAPLGQVRANVVKNDAPEKPKRLILDEDKVIDKDTVDIVYALKVLAALGKDIGDDVKETMAKKQAKRCQGVYAHAVLSGGNPSYSISPTKFLALCREKGIDDDKIAKCISVSGSKVKFLTPEEIATCETRDGFTNVQMQVYGLPNVNISTLDELINILRRAKKQFKLEEVTKKMTKAPVED